MNKNKRQKSLWKRTILNWLKIIIIFLFVVVGMINKHCNKSDWINKSYKILRPMLNYLKFQMMKTIQFLKGKKKMKKIMKKLLIIIIPYKKKT